MPIVFLSEADANKCLYPLILHRSYTDYSVLPDSATLRMQAHWGIWVALQFCCTVNSNVLKSSELEYNPPVLKICGPKCKKSKVFFVV